MFTFCQTADECTNLFGYHIIPGFQAFIQQEEENMFDPESNFQNLQFKRHTCITLPETNIAHENPHLSW